MSKTVMALLAIVVIASIMGTSITLAYAAKPEIVTDTGVVVIPRFNIDWCGENTQVDKTFRFFFTIFGGDNYKIEVTETYELFDDSEVLIGKGFGALKDQGRFTGDVEIFKSKTKIVCNNGEENPVNIQSGYTVNRNGQVNHGN
jgi:hypothetical protein